MRFDLGDRNGPATGKGVDSLMTVSTIGIVPDPLISCVGIAFWSVLYGLLLLSCQAKRPPKRGK